MSKKLSFHGITQNWTLAEWCDCSPRMLRAYVQAFNDKFGSDKNHSFYIVSSSKGYKLTRNRKEIAEAIERDEAIARRRMARIQKRKRGLKKLNNHALHGDGLV